MALAFIGTTALVSWCLIGISPHFHLPLSFHHSLSRSLSPRFVSLTLLFVSEWELILKSGWEVESVRKIFETDANVARYGVDAKMLLQRKEDFRVSVVIDGQDNATAAMESVTAALKTSASKMNAHVFICTHTGGGSPESPQFWLAATPATGGKGNAMDYLRERLAATAECTLVAGDSGNDAPCFDAQARGGVRGIVVSNAQEELRTFARSHDPHSGSEKGHVFAQKPVAAAIVEGMDLLGF